MHAIDMAAVHEGPGHLPAGFIGAEIGVLIAWHHEVYGVSDLESHARTHGRWFCRVQEPHGLVVYSPVWGFVEVTTDCHHGPIRVRILGQCHRDWLLGHLGYRGGEWKHVKV